jgi:hypothetical protein
VSVEEILFTVGAAVLAAEFFDFLCWLAKRTACYAAHLRYGATERAEVRADEWEDTIQVRPGQVLKLVTALGFLSSGIWAAANRRLRRERTPTFSSATNMGHVPANAIPFSRSRGSELLMVVGPFVGAEVILGSAAALARLNLSPLVSMALFFLGCLAALGYAWLIDCDDLIERRSRSEYARRPKPEWRILAWQNAEVFSVEVLPDLSPPPTCVPPGTLVRPYVLTASERARRPVAGEAAGHVAPSAPRPVRLGRMENRRSR